MNDSRRWPGDARPGGRWLVALGVIALVGAPNVAEAQDGTAGGGAVVGRVVTDVTDAPIEGAHVEVVGRGRYAVTDENGRFRIRSLAPGVISLRTSALGFAPRITTDVVVSTGKPTGLTIRLGVAPIALEGITVTPSVFVRSADAPTSSHRLNAEEVRRAPGAQEDVVRAVALLPGVAPTRLHRADLIVRGGAPFENLFLVDQLEVPNINHFGSQGSSGGPVSIVNLDFVSHANFSAGGFGARHGDRVGSVTELGLREGNGERHAGEANLASTGFGLIGEGPLGAGSYLVGVRRSYLDLIFELAGEPFLIRYWDGSAKVTQSLGERDRLSWIFVGAIDDYALSDETAEDRYENTAIMDNDQERYVTGLTWSRWGDRHRVRVTAGRVLQRFDAVQNDSLARPVFTHRSSEAKNSLSVDVTRALADGGRVDAGASLRYHDDLSYDTDLPGFLRRDEAGAPRPFSVDSSFTAVRVGAFAQAVVPWTPRVRTTVGVRVDRYGELDGAVRVSPRMAATFDVTDDAAVNVSGGRYWQAPSFIWLTGDPSNSGRLKPFRVDQAVVGVERLLWDDLKLQVEAFYRRYEDYPARVWRPQAVLAPAGFEDVYADIPFGLEPLRSAGSGYTYGAELLLRKKLGSVPLYGLVSVSANRARFTGLDGIERVGTYDAPLMGNIAAGWRPSDVWEVGAKFRIAPGRVTTPFIESGPAAGRLDFERYNEGPRLPAFHALDLRVDRRWPFGRAQLTTYLDVKNIYGRENVYALRWDDRESAPVMEATPGILPSIGISLEF